MCSRPACLGRSPRRPRGAASKSARKRLSATVPSRNTCTGKHARGIAPPPHLPIPARVQESHSMLRAHAGRARGAKKPAPTTRKRRLQRLCHNCHCSPTSLRARVTPLKAAAMAFLATRARAAVCRVATRTVHARAMATLHFTKDHEWVSVSWRAASPQPRRRRRPRPTAGAPPTARGGIRVRYAGRLPAGAGEALGGRRVPDRRPRHCLDRIDAAQVDGDSAVIGITQYAQDQMGDVVHVSLPDVGEELSVG